MFKKYKETLKRIQLSIHTSLYIDAGDIEDINVYQVHKISYNPIYLKVKIYTSRPGFVIGRQGKLFYQIQENLQKDLKKRIRLEIVDYQPFGR